VIFGLETALSGVIGLIDLIRAAIRDLFGGMVVVVLVVVSQRGHYLHSSLIISASLQLD